MPKEARRSRRSILQGLGAVALGGLTLPKRADAETRLFRRGARVDPARPRMDQLESGDWKIIKSEAIEWDQDLPRRITRMLRELDGLYTGFPVSQLTHMLQTATRAYRANAGDDLVLCALIHDMGKVISVRGHDAIAAQMVKPYVTEAAYHILRTHSDLSVNFPRPAEPGSGNPLWVQIGKGL